MKLNVKINIIQVSVSNIQAKNGSDTSNLS